MSRRGFTLIEVMVALVILEVGLLGVVGTLVLASRTLARASLLERSVGQVESVLDSLAESRTSGMGELAAQGGVLSWTVALDGTASVKFQSEVGVVSFEVWTFLPVDG